MKEIKVANQKKVEPKAAEKITRIEGGSPVRSEGTGRFVTGTWSTRVEVATKTMPSKPTFAK